MNVDLFLRSPNLELAREFLILGRRERASHDIAAVTEDELARRNRPEVTGRVDATTDNHCAEEGAFRWRAIIEGLQYDLIEALAAIPPPCGVAFFERATKQIFGSSDGELQGGRVQGDDFAAPVGEHKQITVVRLPGVLADILDRRSVA